MVPGMRGHHHDPTTIHRSTSDEPTASVPQHRSAQALQLADKEAQRLQWYLTHRSQPHV